MDMFWKIIAAMASVAATLGALYGLVTVPVLRLLKAEIGTLRSDMKGEIGTVRAEIATFRAEVKAEIAASEARLNERIDTRLVHR